MLVNSTTVILLCPVQWMEGILVLGSWFLVLRHWFFVVGSLKKTGQTLFLVTGSRKTSGISLVFISEFIYKTPY